MQLGRHYSITIRGETYYAVCVGTDDQACYLKDINGNLLVVSYSDDLAFSTVAETMKYSDKLNDICNQDIDKEFDIILQEAFAARKLVTPDAPLPTQERVANISQSIKHLQKLNESLMKVEELLRSQGLGYDTYQSIQIQPSREMIEVSEQKTPTQMR